MLLLSFSAIEGTIEKDATATKARVVPVPVHLPLAAKSVAPIMVAMGAVMAAGTDATEGGTEAEAEPITVDETEAVEGATAVPSLGATTSARSGDVAQARADNLATESLDGLGPADMRTTEW